MQTVQDLALFCGERHEDLGSLASHAHQPDRRLGVALDDALEKDIDRVDLRIESCGLVVPVSAALAVVHDNHDGLENHIDGFDMGRYCAEESGIVQRSHNRGIQKEGERHEIVHVVAKRTSEDGDLMQRRG